MKNKTDLNFNIKAHDKVAYIYDKNHPEIYNDIEQDRLNKSLKNAADLITSSNDKIYAFDYGCGAGNLTNHFVQLGFKVLSGDISQKFLNLIEERFANKDVATTLINGVNLKGMSDEIFDFVATYSVLHHIPDYLTAIQEMCRVVRKGGIIYLDHERSPEFWNNSNPDLIALNQISKPKTSPLILLNLFNPKFYIRRWNKFKNPRWQAEGDIHVWHDDHIEWDKIKKVVEEAGFEVLIENDYLHYQPIYSIEIWEKYKSKCTDMRTLVARKK